MNIFSNIERDKLEEKIKLYRVSKDRVQKGKLKEEIIERSHLLLYFLPQTLLKVDQETSSEVYLALSDKVEKLINEYDPVKGTSFLMYIYQKCYYMLLELGRKKWKESVISPEYFPSFTLEAISTKPLWDEEESLFKSSPAMYYISKRNRNEVEAMNLSELIKYIVKYRDREKPIGLNSKEKFLNNYLIEEKNRLQFLTYLLALKDDGEFENINHISLIFSLSESVFNRFWELKRMFLQNDIQQREHERELAERYWKLSKEYEASLETETDEERITTLKFLIERSKRLSKTKREKSLEKAGLKLVEISSVIDLSKSTAFNYISNIKKILKNLDEDEKVLYYKHPVLL